MSFSFKKIIFLVLLFDVFSCKHKQKQDLPKAKISDCKTMCQKITSCASVNVAKIAARKHVTFETKEKGLKLYSNLKKCVSACQRNLNKKTKGINFYSIFLGFQKECFKEPSCGDFIKCREDKFKEAINKYPLETTVVTRCKKVCKTIDKCANLIVPQMLGPKFSQLPMDKQAEIIRVQSDKDKCLVKCKYNFIRNTKNKNNDEFSMNFYKFVNCLSYNDCGQFTRCVIGQSSGE